MQSAQLVSFFREQFFIRDLKSTKREAVIKELIGPLVDSGNIKNPDLVLETLYKRETLGSTGIGKSVAVPHCRTLVCSEIHIVIGISEKGVDFKAPDKKKVYLFFLILAPPSDKSNLYLPILGKIVETVRDAKIRRSLLKAKDFGKFVEIFEGG